MRAARWVCLLLAAAGAAAGQGELLRNGGLEGDWRTLAPGWHDNVWGEPRPGVSYARDVVAGQAAQRVDVATLPPGSGVILRQDFPFQRGHTYTATVKLRGSAGMTVAVQLRRAGQWYDSAAFRLVTLGPAWQDVTIRGGFAADVPGFLGVACRTPGTFWLASASLRDVSDETLRTPPPKQPVPATFFGIHINKLGSHNTWPDLGAGLLRLWDTGTTWSHLQPARERWDWTRLDYYLRHVERHAPGTAVLLTLGIAPHWAAQPGGRDIYAGSTAPPADLADWRTYVRTTAEHCRGRVRYWEIANECNVNVFYTGSIAQMRDMARVAREELKAVDADNVVLSPNVTRDGLAWLDEYLAGGGGQYADIISCHFYPSARPEDELPQYAGVQDVLRARGQGDKPLWNTEGAVDGPIDPGPQAARGAVARACLTMWCQGISNFNWYCWDIHWPHGVNLGTTLLGSELTPAGIAWRELAGWLRGATVTAREVRGDLWLLTVQGPDGHDAHVVWSSGPAVPLAVPADWGAQALRRLTGRREPLPAALEVDGEPVLVE
jgi:hypothetical protein